MYVPMLVLTSIGGCIAASLPDLTATPFFFLKLRSIDARSLQGSFNDTCREYEGSVASCQALCFEDQECSTFIYDRNKPCSCRFTSLPLCVFRSPFESVNANEMGHFESRPMQDVLLGINQDGKSLHQFREMFCYGGFAPVWDSRSPQVPVLQILVDSTGRATHFSHQTRTFQQHQPPASCETFCLQSLSLFDLDCKFVHLVRRQVGHEVLHNCYLYGSNGLRSLRTLQSMDLIDRLNDRSIWSSVSFMPGVWTESDHKCTEPEWASALLDEIGAQANSDAGPALLPPSESFLNGLPSAVVMANVDEPNILSDSYYPLNSLGLVYQILALVAVFVFLGFFIGLCFFFCPYMAARRTHRNRHQPHHVHNHVVDVVSKSKRPFNHSQWGQYSSASSVPEYHKNRIIHPIPWAVNQDKRSTTSTSADPHQIVVVSSSRP